MKTTKFFSVDNLPDSISPPCVPALIKYKEIYSKNSDLIITYKQLNIEDIHLDILNDFNRYQEVTKCWRKQNGDWDGKLSLVFSTKSEQLFTPPHLW
jgi:hypothetical protein